MVTRQIFHINKRRFAEIRTQYGIKWPIQVSSSSSLSSFRLSYWIAWDHCICVRVDGGIVIAIFVVVVMFSLPSSSSLCIRFTIHSFFRFNLDMRLSLSLFPFKYNTFLTTKIEFKTNLKQKASERKNNNNKKKTTTTDRQNNKLYKA